MIYTTELFLVNLNLRFSELLRANGYDIQWFEDGSTELHTNGGTAKDTITLVSNFPVNPLHIVKRGTSSGLNEENDIAIPAFALRLDSPRKVRRMGLGMKVFERNRRLTIDGFATDEFQQRELGDLFYSWAESDDDLAFFDYADPLDPIELDTVEKVWQEVITEELIHEVETIRYYIRLSVNLRYYE